jgi:phosphatidate cytidylyltransferase
LVLDKNRIFIGFLLLLVLLSSYLLQKEFYLALILISLAIFEICKLKVTNINHLISMIFLSSLIIYIAPNPFFLSSIFILASLLFVFYNKHRFYSFIVSVIFFLYFLLFISLYNSLFFYLIIIISFLNDSTAYIFGKLLKGPLILPSISPNKTISGTSISFLISFITLIYLDFNIFISFMISISLFLGDVYFSYFKRINKIKDYSNILSGHGGIFDRIDSMIFSSFIIFIFINL